MLQIKDQMEVLGSDGTHVGTVDHLEDNNIIKLSKNDVAAQGEHHFIPIDWVDHVDQNVHLNVRADEAFENWNPA